jgi:hypothetical protein
MVEEEEERDEAGVPLSTTSVSYMGLLAKGGVTFYQQGTHHLSLDDGSFILLESDSIPLALYEGKRVRIRGSVRPTVEAGGLIMDAQEVVVVDERGITKSEGQFCGGVAGIPCPSGYECIRESADRDAAGVCRREKMVEETKEAEEAEEAEGGGVTEPEPGSEEPEVTPEKPAEEAQLGAKPTLAPSTNSPALEAHIELMAGDDISPSRWTQEYESQHVGLRVSLHKNAYWRNFGARPDQNSFLHLEVGHREIVELGDGPVTLDLKGGTLASLGVAEGGVVERDDIIEAYRTFDANRYVVISGDARLKNYIEYMLGAVRKVGE